MVCQSILHQYLLTDFVCGVFFTILLILPVEEMCQTALPNWDRNSLGGISATDFYTQLLDKYTQLNMYILIIRLGSSHVAHVCTKSKKYIPKGGRSNFSRILFHEDSK